jgi:tetratricopeptide (TPR) repeat protein
MKNKPKPKQDQKNDASGIWEVGIVPEPMFGTIGPDGKPLTMVIIAHQLSYYILNSNVIAPDVSEEKGVVDAFEKAVAKGPMLPGVIHVKEARLVEYLREVATKHGAEVNVVKKLKAVQEIVRSMKQMRRQMPVEPEPTESIDDMYYDAMDAINENKLEKAAKLLLRALNIDPHYVQTYVGLCSVYRITGEAEKYRETAIKGYEETRNIFKKWPKELSWYHMENRRFHRAIFFRAGLHIEDGETEQGMELYRQLLSMWPGDNLGVRYYAAAVCAGMSIQQVDDLWDESNEKQNWDELEKMVMVQNRKHKFWKGS